jgi:hypothetical protein
VDKGNGIFEPRRVKTGWSFGGQVQIIHGLMAGEKVVVAGNFLIDSESRMGMAASGAEAEGSDDAPVHGKSVEKDQVPDWAAMLQEKAPVSTKPAVPPKARRDATSKKPPKAAPPDNEDESEENRQGTYPFPGAQYLGTVPRDPAPAKGEPPKDKLPPGRFEPSAAPPSGTRLK